MAFGYKNTEYLEEPIMQIALSVVIVIACIILIAAVTMQEGQKDGLGAISGSAETFFGKSKASGAQAMLKKVTIAAGVIVMLCAIIMNCL